MLIDRDIDPPPHENVCRLHVAVKSVLYHKSLDITPGSSLEKDVYSGETA